MFEVDVKNVMEKEGREGGKDQLGFGVLILKKSTSSKGFQQCKKLITQSGT